MSKSINLSGRSKESSEQCNESYLLVQYATFLIPASQAHLLSHVIPAEKRYTGQDSKYELKIKDDRLQLEMYSHEEVVAAYAARRLES